MVRITYDDPKDGEFVVVKMWTAVKAGPNGENISFITLEDDRKLCVLDSSLISSRRR